MTAKKEAHRLQPAGFRGRNIHLEMMFYVPHHMAKEVAVSLKSGVIFLRYFTAAFRAL